MTETVSVGDVTASASTQPWSNTTGTLALTLDNIQDNESGNIVELSITLSLQESNKLKVDSGTFKLKAGVKASTVSELAWEGLNLTTLGGVKVTGVTLTGNDSGDTGTWTITAASFTTEENA